MNEFQLYINNEWTTFEVLNGDTYSWRADDTLDSGTVLFVSDDKMPIAPFTLAKVNFQGTEDVYMWACDDKVSVYTKGTHKKYQHSIVLGELTKMLEKLEVQGFVSSDNGYDNLNEEVQRFISNYNYIYADKIKLLLTDAYLIADLTAQPSENFTMKSSTVREVLDEMFSAINSRVEVTGCLVNASTGEYTLVIGAFRLNKTISGTIADSDIVAVESQNSADNLAGRLVSEVENAQSPNAIRVVDTFKYKYGEALATNQRIMSLPYAIEYPTAFSMSVGDNTIRVQYDFDYGGTTYQGLKTYDFSTLRFDCLENFVDKEYWDTLGSATSNYIYYERGSTEIDVSLTYKKLLLTTSNLLTIVRGKLLTYIQDNWDTLKPVNPLQQNPRNPRIYDTISVDDIYYDLTYQARIDGLVMAFKNKDNRYGNQLAIYDNQSDSVIDIERYGGNLAGKIRRTGNDELYIDCNYQAYANILPLLTKTTIDGKDYVVYQVDFSRFYNGENYNYLVRYYLAEDYNNLNERIGIRRQKRIYEIPLTGYRTILPKIHTISISSGSKQGTRTRLVREFVDTIGYPPAQRTRQRKVENAKVVVDNFTGGMNTTFTLPAIAYGAGQTVNLITKFYDNYSAGLSVTNTHLILSWVGGKKVLYNPYVYNNGQAYDFDVSFGSFATRSAEGIKKQPAPPSSPETLSIVVNDDFNYKKDSAESLTFQEIVNLKADGVILGNMLTAKNTLTVDNPPILYVWTTDTETYLQGDNKCKGTRSSGISVTAQDSFYEITANLPRGHKTAVALGDYDGNLYVAKNGSFSSQTYFYITEI